MFGLNFHNKLKSLNFSIMPRPQRLKLNKGSFEQGYLLACQSILVNEKKKGIYQIKTSL